MTLRIFLLFFVAVLFQNCQSNTEATAEIKPVNWGEYELTDVPGADYKLAVKKDEAGTIVERGTVRNFMKNGAWMTYHIGEDAGKIRSLTTFVDDQYNGIYLEISDRGQLKLEANYANNKLNGRWAKYNAGWIVEEAEYKNGLLNGTYRSYFESAKQVQKEAQYKDGVQDGFFKQYDKDGKVLLSYVFRDGQKVEGGIIE